MPTPLPARASLEFLRKQSKDLRQAFAAGETEALQQIHDHLPRARQLADEDLRGLDLSLQEAQHALACEYGFGKWEDLLVAVEPPSFDDLARLSDRATALLLREVAQHDVVYGLIGASDQVKERLLKPMTERVGDFIRTEMVFAGAPPAEEIEACRSRIVTKVLELRERGVLQWPSSGNVPAPGPGRANPGTDRLSTPLMDLTPYELLDILVGSAEEARREGIVSLERNIGQGPGTLLTAGVQLATDGTKPDLLQDILERRAATILRGRTLRAHLAIEGWLSIHLGDNPAIVQQKMESIFIEAPEPTRFTESIPPAAQLVQRLRAASASCASPPQMVSYYVDLSTLARLRGRPAALAVVAGIRASVEEGLESKDVVEAMTRCAQHERLELHRRHCMVIHGIVRIQAGDNPRFIEEQVPEAGERGVAELAAKGFPSQL